MALRRLIIVMLGFALSASVGAIFLVVAAFFDPATREAGFAATMAGLFAIINEALMDGAPEETFSAFFHVAQAILIATCVAPLAFAALIGEIAGARSIVWYSGITALLAGASPWIARAAKGLDRAQSMSPVESRITLLFFLTGALIGALYWLIAAPAGPASERANEPQTPDTRGFGPPRKD